MNFSLLLTKWYLQNKRDLPWRKTQNPYYIWLSEVILQQTKVRQGLNYYVKFVKNYPNVNHLASATEDEVLKLWQGLGYYSRAKNMLHTARTVASEMDGEFPQTYNELIKLKGIGKYSAAAISSFAFNEARAVVDGNVYRVLARVFAISTPINTSKGEKIFSELAAELLDKKNPATHNQAIMEFGALQCTPKNPDCQSCVLRYNCIAGASNSFDKFPVKKGKTKVRTRYMNYLVMESPDFLYFNKREKKDIWQGLYDFPLIESGNEHQFDINSAITAAEKLTENVEFSLSEPLKEYKHILSHQKLKVKFWHFRMSENVHNNFLYLPVKKELAGKVAVPVLIEKYMKDTYLLD